MQIEYKDIQSGVQVLFDGEGPLFTVLSGSLSIFDSEWRKVKRKPWHVGFVIDRESVVRAMANVPWLDAGRRQRIKALLETYSNRWWVCESIACGITVTPLIYYSPESLRYYKWHDKPSTIDQDTRYLIDHLGLPYDPLVYIWTTGATLIDKVFRLNIGVWENDSYMCWENLEEYDEYRGKPLSKRNRTITICDIYKTLTK